MTHKHIDLTPGADDGPDKGYKSEIPIEAETIEDRMGHAVNAIVTAVDEALNTPGVAQFVGDRLTAGFGPPDHIKVTVDAIPPRGCCDGPGITITARWRREGQDDLIVTYGERTYDYPDDLPF